VALAAGVPLVAVLGLGQALLPVLAEQRVRDRLKPYGAVQSVSVSAFPALEMAWGKAGSVSVAARELRMSETQALELAWEARGVDTVRASIGRLQIGIPGLAQGLALHDASVVKRGGRLSVQATFSQADIAAALPPGFTVQPLGGQGSSGGEGGGLRVRASGGLFGARASLEALVTARAGRLVVVPQGLPLAGLFQVTLLADQHLYAESISATPVSGERETWRLALGGSLR
jgi:hypothetical protein